MQRKAVLEIQFHWIFVLIVGAVVLLFFGSVIYKQKETSDKGLSAEVLNSLENIFTGSMISTKTLNLIELPRGTEIVVRDCDSYSIGSFSKQTKTMPLFAPEEIYGSMLITWSLDWNVPFRVSNLLYISSDEVRYIIVDNTDDPTDFMDILNDLIPEEVTKDFVYYYGSTFFYKEDDSEIKEKGDYKIRFVFYNADMSAVDIPAEFSHLAEKDLTAINIKPISNVPGINYGEDVGEIDFYRKQGTGFTPYFPTGSTKPYLKKESIMGAVFAENPNTYECAMKKALRRLVYVTDIYEQRTNYFLTTLTTTPNPDICLYPTYFYQTSQFVSLKGNANNALSDFSQGKIEAIYKSAFDDAGMTASIAELNKAALLQTCPVIY